MGSRISGRGIRNFVDAREFALTSISATLVVAVCVAGSVNSAICGIHLPSGEKFVPCAMNPFETTLPSTSSGGPPSMGTLMIRLLGWAKKKAHFPSGEQSGNSSSLPFVSCLGCDPSASTLQIFMVVFPSLKYHCKRIGPPLRHADNHPIVALGSESRAVCWLPSGDSRSTEVEVVTIKFPPLSQSRPRTVA